MSRQVIEQDASFYDVFLSHASEDKDDVARPLAISLQERGLRVWFDEFELKVGDNLVAKLNAGINASRFGIIVLSRSFFAKRWTNHELDMLEYLWVTKDRIIIPVWHNTSFEEIAAFRVWLANIIGLRTDTNTITELADEIYSDIMRFYAREQETGTDEV